MRKGISPLVASVLLIAITIAIAGILASWVTSYTEETLPQTSCIGGQVGVISADYPYWDGSGIVAAIESRNVPLYDLKIVVLAIDDNIYTFDDVEGVELPAGGFGTIKTGDITDTISVNDIWVIQIVAGNCPDVKSGWYELVY